MPTLKEANDVFQASLGPLHELMKSAKETVHAAGVLKIEAMLVQAHRTKIRRTQRELIGAQFAEMAKLDLPETDIHPALLSFAKAILN